MIRGTVAGLAAVGLLAAPTPGVSPDRADVAVGDRLTVQLTGWPAGTVLVELCGNGASRGSVDCAVGSAVQAYVPDSGGATVVLPVAAPPVACPCVVRARDPAGAVTATAPVTVDGAPVEAAHEPVAGSLVFTKVAVSGGWSWPALFGGPARRTLTVTVRHTGDSPVVDPPLTLLVGRGGDPTTLVDAPALGTIAPGEQRTYRLAVSLPAPSFGSYTVRGELAGAAFLAETTSYPWGIPAGLAVLVVAAAAVRLVRRSPRLG